MKKNMQFINRQERQARQEKKTWLLGGLAVQIILLTLSACSAMDSLMATPTPIILTQTPPPTSTRIWFPPSATSTLELVSANDLSTPTPNLQPILGDVLLEDNFSDESLWDIASSNQASAAMDKNRLTLSAQSGVYMISLRHELILTDYYAEITAKPGLCKGEDHYGLLIRATVGTYYRFVLACDGTARIERYANGNKLILQKPEPSGDVPPGAPGQVRIGVWALGKEMRLFLNDRYQFSIIDPSFPSGTIGVFARSVGETPVVVSFEDLMIYEIDN
jgi:hypothetical protein